jgi:DNA-binding transcriptional ArsR family regulator
VRFNVVIVHNQVVIEQMQTDPLSAVFGALADPTRRAILASLAGGERTVAELGAPFAISQPAVSKHLRVLEEAGLITRSKRATARLSHLRAAPLEQASTWLLGYREYWEESYERLDELLERLQAPAPAETPPAESIEEGRVP